MQTLGNPINRVLQLDGSILEDQVASILEEKLTGALSDSSLPLKIQRIGSRYDKDIKVILKLLLFKLFIWDKSSTYGLILQNLKISNNKQKSLNKLGKLVILISILSNYLIDKLLSFLYSGEFEELESENPKLFNVLNKLNDMIPKINKIFGILDISNTLTFLLFGDYTSVFNRLFKIRHERLNDLTVSFASNPQTLSYEFQDRQLIWNAITEFLTNLSKVPIPRTIKKIWKKGVKRSNNIDLADDSKSMFKFLPERCCAICYFNDLSLDKNIDDNLITNAYITNCDHIYCYFCILNEMERARLNDDNEHWNCLRCNENVKFIKIYNQGMDELEEEVEEYLQSLDEIEAEEEEEEEEITPSDQELKTDTESEDDESDTDPRNESNSDSEESAYEYNADEM